MTFLQPFILWGLLLGLLPILIHLFNRLRHRKLPWAAMMFLRMANRKSTKYAKVRQWLVLLFRMLAVMALVFALSRPLAGGWIKGMMSGKPDVILIVVDRSASMGAQSGEKTRLERALEVMIDSAKSYGEGVRLVVMEHTDQRPREVKGGADALKNVIGSGVTDTSADIPGLLENAADWFKKTKPGIGEIWVASDLQASNWDSTAKGRWQQISSKLDTLPQSVRVRLMAMDEEAPANVSVRTKSVARQRVADRVELVLQLEFSRGTALAGEVDLAVFVEGEENGETISLEGATHVHELRFPLRKGDQSGWGYVELVDKEDGNAQDNVAYFVYGEPVKAKTAVVGNPDLFPTQFLNLAAAPDPANTNQVSEIITPGGIEGRVWTDYAMVLWQDKLPQGDSAEKLSQYIKAGGLVVCFPNQAPDEVRFNGLGWGALKRYEDDGKQFETWQQLVAAENDQEHLGFRITSYTDNEGPLQRTEEGLYLPVDDLRVNQRRAIEGDGLIQAAFEDGVPWLMVKTVGRGQVVFCGTQPSDQWSSLTEGLVLVPMLQRLLSQGEAMLSGRFVQGHMLIAGDDRANEGERWVSEEVGEGSVKDFNSQAGVYRMGQRIVAVNRPEREDLSSSLEADGVRGLFGEVPVALTQERAQDGASDDPKEIWQWFLVAMAMALLIEGILILPRGADERVEIQTTTSGKVAAKGGV
ncbi:MAG: BatA domain-containing protein [Verrucomicrobiota bacterium]|nr:BatA domain-containing protein [Verrucomicrobiota bacterium]